MIERVIIAGSGGQGIMLLGKILAQAAMYEDKFITWLPAYGAEVRGGTAHCMVVIADEEISSPYIIQADCLIIMNAPSLEKFKARLKHNGLMLVNSSLANQPINKKVKAHGYPFTDLAMKLGNIKVANVIALGCLLAHKKIVNLKTVLAVIKDMAPAEKKELIRINQRALEKGAGLK